MKRLLINIGIVIAIGFVGHFIAYKMFNIPKRTEFVFILIAFLFYPIIRNPLIGVYSYFIISPFLPYLRRLYYLTFARPKVDPLIIIGDAILAVTLIGLFFEWKDRLEENPKVAPFVRIIAIYFFYLIFRTFVFNNLNASKAITVFKLYGPPVLLFFIGIMYANQQQNLRRIWALTVIIGLASCAYGIKQLYGGYSQAEQIWFESIKFSTLFIEDIARPFSFFQAPVVFADYMQIAIIAILLLVEWSKSKTRYTLMAFVPILFYGALITSVRSSWAGILATFLLWYTLFRVKGGKQRIATFVGVIIAYIIYEFVNEIVGGGLGVDRFLGAVARTAPNPDQVDMLVTNRATALTNPFEEHSFLSRMTLWKSLLAYSANPIYAFMGRGIGTLKADSLYFTYLAELGYPGVIFIIGVIIAFVRKGFYIIDNSKNKDSIELAKGITILNIIFAIVSITGTHIHYFPGDAYFWFWNGILIKLSADIEREKSESPAT